MTPTRFLLPIALGTGLAAVFIASGEEKPVADKDAATVPAMKAPAKFTNTTPTPAQYQLPSMNRMFVSQNIHDIVAKKGGPSAAGEMKDYDETVPRADGAKYKLVVIKGGEFVIGSPDGEADREDDEGPLRKVVVEPFWIGQTEIPWSLYKPFYENGVARNKDGTLLAAGAKAVITVKGKNRTKAVQDSLARGDHNNMVDVVSQPTPQYHDMFLSGELPSDLNYPAMCTTHHAASKFCQWLTAQTGHFYRLPTEAEWEYACRAGTTTAYHFGDDVKKLDDYAWHGYNSEFIYHPVATRKPNPWGLYDMHGNVAEWVLDGFTDGYRKGIADGALNPWNIPITRYPRIVKGGSWDQDQDECRSAARLHSINDWKDTDPQVPKSIWYHTDGQHIGFRIVRPLKTPTPAEMHLYWNTDWWEPKRNAEDL
ncbi:MAG: formylglycine-generating enzyme family protein [Roseibacillus sp.]|jgi:formylglycine-generating enzyme required for sulfatase activity